MSGLIAAELGVFPLLCGWWLDICCLELMSGTLNARIAFFNESPCTASFTRWLLGMLYMSYFASFIALLREV